MPILRTTIRQTTRVLRILKIKYYRFNTDIALNDITQPCGKIVIACNVCVILCPTVC